MKRITLWLAAAVVLAVAVLLGTTGQSTSEACGQQVSAGCTVDGQVVGSVRGVPEPYPRSFTVYVSDHVPGQGFWLPVYGSFQRVTATGSNVAFGPLDVSAARSNANSMRVETTYSNAKSESFKPCVARTATPTVTATFEPTETNTPEPAATNTPVPTDTSTPEPTATDTPVPTATNTATVEPTATPVDTEVPTATATAARKTKEPTSTPRAPDVTATPGSVSTPEVAPTAEEPVDDVPVVVAPSTGEGYGGSGGAAELVGVVVGAALVLVAVVSLVAYRRSRS